MAEKDVVHGCLPGQAMVQYPSFKLLILGDSGVGKTSLVNRYPSGQANTRQSSTIPVEVTPLDFETHLGIIRFYCWDPVGQEVVNGKLPDIYYLNAQCAILMFDVTSRPTYEHVYKWYGELKRVCGNIPIVLCGNKADVGKKMDIKQVTIHRKKNLEYIEISALSYYNVEKVFLYLAKKLLRSETLGYAFPSSLSHRTKNMVDVNLQLRRDAKIIKLARKPLPDNDNEVKVKTCWFLC